ncbi:hypothetical protein E2C01_098169 [Portunus trituberculatus]|uniref:Uncharacterized protein n=1 Tax=Portunus trituberculatus TaxID=210409 RepID=A0A5B7KBF5_PORTR|nr:hypothetical protein [Portunus trituberculatus]
MNVVRIARVTQNLLHHRDLWPSTLTAPRDPSLKFPSCHVVLPVILNTTGDSVALGAASAA